MSIQNLSFTRRPSPINPEFRPIYRMSIIILILKIASRGSSASLLKLHFFSWMIKSRERRQMLSMILESTSSQLPIFNIEPSLNQALLYLESEKLVKRNGDRFILSDTGESLASEIISETDILIKEKSFLNLIGKKFTEAKVEELLNNLNK